MNDFRKTKQQLIAQLQLLQTELSNPQPPEASSSKELPSDLEPEKIQIMLLEDSEIDRLTYTQFLSQQQKYSFAIREFDNGLDALTWCVHNLPDVILLDYYLPTMNGLQFLEQISPIIQQNLIPVIVITGQQNPTVAVKLIKMGACDYLDKNQITAASLNQAIDCALTHRGTLKEEKRQLEFQEIISETALKIHQCQNLEQILKTTVTSLRGILNSDRVLVYQVQLDLSCIVIEESAITPSLAISQEIVPLDIFPSDWLEFYRQGNIRIINDIATDQNLSERHLDILTQMQVRSKIAVPILLEGKLWGVLMVHSCFEPRYWQSAEIELIEEIAISMAIAIQQATLVNKLQKQLEEKKLTEASLRQQTAMIDLSHEAIIVRDFESKIIFWNQGAFLTYGWTQEEVVGRLSNNLFQTEFPIPYLTLVETIFNQGYWEGELIHTTQDGGRIIVESRQALMKDSRGEPFCIIESNKNITERKKLEDKLKTSEERLRLTLELTEIGLWDHNLAKNKTIWNDYLFRLWDLEPQSIVPTYQSWLQGIHPEDLEQTQKALQQAIETKSKFDCEYRIIKASGEVLWIIDRACILCDDSGNAIRILGISINITQRKEAEIAIKQQKETLSLFFQYVPAGVAMLDRNLRYIMASQAWVKGANAPSLEYILGRSDEELFPEIPLEWIEMLKTCLKGATAKCDEGFVMRPDGTPKWFAWEARPWYDYNLEIAGVIIFSEDITERKLSEIAFKELNASLKQKIQQSTQELTQLNDNLQQQLLKKDKLQAELLEREQLLTGFFNAASDAEIGATIVDQQMRYLAINETLAKMHGYPVEAHLKKSISEILPDLSPIIIPLCQHILATKQSLVNQEISGFVPSSPGVLRHWLASYFPIFGENQQIMALGGIIIEVTEQKKDEATLKAFKRKWGCLFDNVQLLVLELDDKGYIQSANPFFFQLTQYTESEVVGKHWFNDFIVSYKDNNFKELLDQDSFKQYNHSLLTKSGQELVISWNNTIIKKINEQIVGVISIGENITERYQLAKMKDEFISIVSHELRTPLTSMQAGLSLINEKIIDFNSPEGETTIQIVTEGVDRLARLVNDILALSRLESGKVSMKKETFFVSDLFNSAVAQMQELAKQAKITIKTNAPTLQVYGDFDRLLQVLLNLLSNAIKFSPQNTSVIVTGEKQNSHLLFKVIDSGRGIPCDKLSKVFESFYQVDSSDSRTKEGTGLGLSICQNIIQQHGGIIWVESTLSKGSTFFFTIPD